MEKTEPLNVFFTSVFSNKTSLHETQVPETRGKQDVRKPVGPYWIHPLVLTTAGRCHCNATLSNLSFILVIGKSAQRLVESKCQPCLQEGQAGASWTLQACLSHLDPLGGCWSR